MVEEIDISTITVGELGFLFFFPSFSLSFFSPFFLSFDGTAV
jgi:hypothetical protein